MLDKVGDFVVYYGTSYDEDGLLEDGSYCIIVRRSAQEACFVVLVSGCMAAWNGGEGYEKT
jgi:hypothetical protein